MSDSYWVADPRAKGGRFLVQTRPTTRQRKRQKEFAMVPLQQAAVMAKATRTPGAMVWLMLIYTAWRANSAAFPFTNVALKRYGIHRNTKLHTLKILEDAGLIKVEWRRKQSPIVTLLSNQ